MSERQSQASGDVAATQFADVLAAELEVLARQRAESVGNTGTVFRRARDMKLAGLAFSGGGIRSATFNLGFLQGLGNRRVLHAFDYLSTVSGGGYVGGWLSALLLRRNGGKPTAEGDVRRLAAQELTTPLRENAPTREADFGPPESAAVRFVRRYADYLTPRLGLSGDTLALLSVGLRNVVVIQMLLLSLLVGTFSALLLLAGGGWVSARSLFASPPQALRVLFEGLGLSYAQPGHWLMLPAFCLLLLALLTAIYSQLNRPRQLPNLFITGCVLLPSLLSGVFFALALQTAASHEPISPGGWIALPMLGYLLAWSVTLKQARAWIGMLAAAATLVAVLWTGVGPLSALLAKAPFGHAVAFAPIVAIAIISFVITMHLAMAGPAIHEQEREWWARAGGQSIFFALAWTVALAFLLYVPPLIDYSLKSATATGALWTALTWIGARLAQGKDTGAQGGAGWKEVLAGLAPWLFIVGMLGLVAWIYVELLIRPDYGGATEPTTMIAAYHVSLAQRVGADHFLLSGVGIGSLTLFAAFLYLVDLNIFSAHSFYRFRLARSFLGASRSPRQPNRYTGFDPQDDLALAALAGQRPIPLINANLNLTGGEELAWQTRRGASFAFTPAHCGFTMQTTSGRMIGGYRPTARYGGSLSLATAMAVSGAAASPNMGFHTSTSVAALLTVLNLRLARWCPNPEMTCWRDAAPTWGAGYLFAELLGEANGKKSWINLSDGGHFDNLGLYELVRRRASLIVVTDAGADEGYRFDDLAMVTRKLWTDFAVRLEIAETELAAIRPGPSQQARSGDPAFSKRHWAFGRIHYPEGPPACLIYVKSSVTCDIPVDIRQYKDTHPAFPHEPTADQWFDEDQFEAYRHLGQIVAEQLFDSLLPEHAATGDTLRATELVATLMSRMNCTAAAAQD